MRSSSDQQPNRVELGRFGKAYGVKGWLRLNSFTSPAENICKYDTLVAEINGSWVMLEIDEYSAQPNSLVVHVAGYDSPETARTLTGTGIWIDSSALPPLANGEYYWHQLQGLTVVNQQGAVFGVVSALMETGANDVLIVSPTGRSIDDRQRLIPYLPGKVVKQVSLDSELVTVDWGTDYLE